MTKSRQCKVRAAAMHHTMQSPMQSPSCRDAPHYAKSDAKSELPRCTTLCKVRCKVRAAAMHHTMQSPMQSPSCRDASHYAKSDAKSELPRCTASRQPNVGAGLGQPTAGHDTTPPAQAFRRVRPGATEIRLRPDFRTATTGLAPHRHQRQPGDTIIDHTTIIDMMVAWS